MAIIINPYTIMAFFAGIISLILGIYALYKNPKERPTQVFFIMMLGCALWSLTPVIIQASSSAEQATLWAKVSNVGLLIIPVTLFHFTFVYHRKKVIAFSKIAIIYVITIIMIILLLGTNLFFVMADDVLIDGDGAKTNERGSGNYTEEDYWPLPDNDLSLFYFIDLNEDGFYTIENETDEPLFYNNTLIVGFAANGTIVTLNDSENFNFIYFVDEDGNGRYTIGESLYLENGDGNQKLVYNYLAGPLYIFLIIFFFGFIIGSIVNLFLFYRKTEEEGVKKPVLYLIFGLIAIIVFILMQIILGPFLPEAIIFLDNAIAFVISIFFTVAVLKYNIVDIKLIIRKSMFYSAASLIVVACFVLVEESMEFLFAELAFSGSILSGVIAAFAALILFTVMRRGLKRQIDKLFPSVRYLDKEYQNRIIAYKATLYAMLADGILSKKEESAIDILRDKLEITAKEHDKLMKSMKIERRERPDSYSL